MSQSRGRTPPPSAAADPSSPSKHGKRALQDRVWESLSELCQSVDPQSFRLGETSLGTTVDLSASFLRNVERDYDWFDLDKDGGIILQPKVPMFPEDFPPGKPLHPLSWWGIVEPSLGARKRPKIAPLSEKESTPLVTKGENKGRQNRGPSEEYQLQNMLEKKRSRSRSRDRLSASGRPGEKLSVGKRESRRGAGGSPDAFERYQQRSRAPPPPHSVRRGDPYLQGPPSTKGGADRGPPFSDERWRMDDRRAGGGGGPPDRRFLNQMPYPPRDDRQRYPPDDRSRYGTSGGPRRDEPLPPPMIRDDRGRNERPRYPDDRRSGGGPQPDKF